MTDNVNHPAHYTQYKREVIELTSLLDFTLGNAVKYILRAPYKGKMEEDLAKACWYLRHQHTIERSVVPAEALKIVSDYEHPYLDKLLNIFPSVCDGEKRPWVKCAVDEFIADYIAKTAKN